MVISGAALKYVRRDKKPKADKKTQTTVLRRGGKIVSRIERPKQ